MKNAILSPLNRAVFTRTRYNQTSVNEQLNLFDGWDDFANPILFIRYQSALDSSGVQSTNTDYPHTEPVSDNRFCCAG
jgi:hypothetical protein